MTNRKAVSVFVPKTELENIVYGGDPQAVAEYLSGIADADRRKQGASVRRMFQLMQKSRFSDATPPPWGMQPTEGQQRALNTALFVCGDTNDLADAGWGFLNKQDDLISLWGRFPPGGGAQLGDLMLEHSPLMFRVVQALFLAGLIERPTSDNYALGLLALPMRSDRVMSVLHALADDPGLAHGPMLRLFEIEGTQENSLSGQDKYGYGVGGRPEGAIDWQSLYLQLCDQGVYSRALLLDKTLGALEKGWIQFRSGWFSRFHDALAPTAQEMAPHAERYLGLCHSRIPPTVTLAVKSLTALFAEGLVERHALLGALHPVLASAIKGQVDCALKLLDNMVKADSTLASEAAEAVIPALNHEAPEVHKKVIARLNTWGMNEACRQRATELLPHVSASSRAALAALVGSEPAAQIAQAEPLPASTRPRAPLDEDRKLDAITDIDELVERTAYALENETDVDEYERVLEALVRLAPYTPEHTKRFAPVIKRAHRLKPNPDDRWNSDKALSRELARLLVFLLDGEHLTASHSYAKNIFTAHSFLCERIDDLMDLAAQGKSVPPLSSPTHQRGFIDARTLIARAAARLEAGVRDSLQEQVLSLLRLAPGASESDRTLARALPETPYTRALRYALGDDIAPGNERELFFAAARIRHPNEDDPVLVARFGDYGPDGPHAARYSFHVDVEASGDYTFYRGRVEIAPAPRPIDPAYLAVMRHPVVTGQQRHYLGYHRFGASHAGLISLSATILPCSLEAFFAEGVHALANNLDWWAAEWHNKAYLERLMDPTTPLTPMANMALALGLAGKEPGQTAIAIDALVAAWLERRLSIPAFAEVLRQLLTTRLVKAPRFHKSLKMAARAHSHAPRLIFELLCTMVIHDARSLPDKIASLLELLLELALELGESLPPSTRAAIEKMNLAGKGKSVQKELLVAAM